MKELGDKLPADKKAPIEAALQKLKDAHKAQDLAAIDTSNKSIQCHCSRKHKISHQLIIMLVFTDFLLTGYIICATTVPDYFTERNWRMSELTSLIYGANVLLFGGLGLVVAFIVELKISQKNRKDHTR